jgi:hypothetical protein
MLLYYGVTGATPEDWLHVLATQYNHQSLCYFKSGLCGFCPSQIAETEIPIDLVVTLFAAASTSFPPEDHITWLLISNSCRKQFPRFFSTRAVHWTVHEAASISNDLQRYLIVLLSLRPEQTRSGCESSKASSCRRYQQSTDI